MLGTHEHVLPVQVKPAWQPPLTAAQSMVPPQPLGAVPHVLPMQACVGFGTQQVLSAWQVPLQVPLTDAQLTVSPHLFTAVPHLRPPQTTALSGTQAPHAPSALQG